LREGKLHLQEITANKKIIIDVSRVFWNIAIRLNAVEDIRYLPKSIKAAQQKEEVQSPSDPPRIFNLT
jgi:hypothetical protein